MPQARSKGSPYNAFAWFYNRYWNEELHECAFPALEYFLLRRLPPGARVLDVCSGTGYLARMLTAGGYSVTCIDASPEMVLYARENDPAAEFQVCDATRFQLP